MTFQKGVHGQDPDYVDVLEVYNEAVAKAQKGRPVPSVNVFLIAVRKHLSDIVYPQYKKRWAYSISEWTRVGKKSRDAPTPEEIRRMRQSDAQDSKHAEDGH